MEKKYFEEIKKIERKYYNIIRNFNTSFPKAINFEEEKKKFLAAIADDREYNPYFKFKSKNFDEKKIKELKNLKINTFNDMYNLKKLYRERLKTKFYEIECHKNWGKPISTKYVIKYRGEPSKILLSRAKNFCKNYKREVVKFTKITPRSAGIKLKLEVKRLTGENISYKFKDINSKMNISAEKNLIKINPNERFTSLDVKRLKVHEIGVHYLRYYNAKKIGLEILQSGTSNYIETEEGLAAYAEYICGVGSKAQMFIYAGRVIATYYALRKSFYEVYQILRSYGFREYDAFAITARAKRNLCDTAQKGGFTKDYVYFSGFYKVEKFAKKNDIKELFIGKIKIEDLKLLRKFIKKYKNEIITPFD